MKRFLATLPYLALCLALTGSVAAQTPAQQQQQQQNPASANANGVDEKTSIGDTMSVASPGAPVDLQFVKLAFMGSMLDTELGRLAEKNSSNDAVKQFGKKMVTDHLKERVAFKKVAEKEKMELPSTLDSKRRERVDKLAKLSGPAFDQAYVQDQLKQHERHVKIFRDEAVNGQDEGLRRLAASYLPSVQEHLDLVRDLSKTLVASASK